MLAFRTTTRQGSGLFGKSLGKASSPSVPARFASEKQLKLRMRAVGNIKKITSAMKMVAAAKLRRAQEQLDTAREYARSMNTLIPESKEGAELPTSGNRALIAMTTDKGLCGAVNSSIIRQVRATVNKQLDGNANEPPKLILIGEKAKGGLERTFGKFITNTLSDTSKLKRFTFLNACAITDNLLKEEIGDSVILFNYFRTLLSFVPKTAPWLSQPSFVEKVDLNTQYELEGDADLEENLYAFQAAVRMYYYFAETEACELSSRMNAMGSSSKNAGDMLNSLSMLYNRTRQARITTELVEIISGAVSLEDSE